MYVNKKTEMNSKADMFTNLQLSLQARKSNKNRIFILPQPGLEHTLSGVKTNKLLRPQLNICNLYIYHVIKI